MKVLFINASFSQITELDRDYSETKEIYQAFLDIEKKFICGQKYPNTREFLTEYGGRQVYFRADTELTYIGNLRTLYLKAQECLSNKWTQDKLEEELYCLFANCP